MCGLCFVFNMTNHNNQSTDNMKILRIGIDGNEANISQRVGSNVYAFELIKHLELITRERSDVSATVFLTQHPLPEMPKERPGWSYQTVHAQKFATQWALPLTLFTMRKRLDIFFTPGHYAPRMCPVPYVSSVMDLAFLYYPKQFKFKDYLQLKLWTKYSVQKAKHVVTISEFSRSDIVKQYHRKLSDTSVVYPATSIIPIEKKDLQKMKSDLFARLHIHSRYILYVGTLQPRKNLISLIEAFERFDLQQHSKPVKKLPQNKKKKKNLQDNEQNYQLVLAGKVGWLSQELLKRIENSPVRSKIVLAGYVSEEEKKILLSNAGCLALIGFYEGFGMPALEALSYGTPVVVSNSSSLPEVVGDAGITVDPHNLDAIQRGLNKALFMTQKQRKEFWAKAKIQSKKFSWESSAQKLLELLQSLNKS